MRSSVSEPGSRISGLLGTAARSFSFLLLTYFLPLDLLFRFLKKPCRTLLAPPFHCWTLSSQVLLPWSLWALGPLLSRRLGFLVEGLALATFGWVVAE